jgi:hypothetical protein
VGEQVAITFDYEAAGIQMQENWKDAESLGQIGAAIGRISSAGSAYPLPSTDSQGPSKLISAIDAFDKAMAWVVLECSDAAANLGSGLEKVAKNFDSTEHYNRERALKLGVEWNK